MSEFIIMYVIAINIVTFLMYGLDKQKARMNRWRIPEKVLMWAAVFGGSLGAYLGMKMFSHKTKKAKFYIGIPVIFIGQVILCVFLILKFS